MLVLSGMKFDSNTAVSPLIVLIPFLQVDRHSCSIRERNVMFDRYNLT